MKSQQTKIVSFLRALSNEKRLQIVEWLLNPTAHFDPQVDGDLVDDGVCLGAIVRKMNISQPTITAHMKVLSQAGLVSSKKLKNWVFFKAEAKRIDLALSRLVQRLKSS